MCYRLRALDQPERESLVDRIDNLRKLYFDHFSSWLEQHEPDWVFAINLTLPHAVSVYVSAVRGGRPSLPDAAGWTCGLGP